MFRLRTAMQYSVCLMLAVLCMLLPFGLQADAHAYSASYTTLNLTKTNTEMTYAIDELSVIELVGGDVNQNGMLEQEEFDTVKDQFLALLQKKLILKLNNEPQNWSRVESFILDRQGDATKAILKVLYPPVSSEQPISLLDQLYVNDKSTANYVDLVTINYGSQKSTSALSGNNRVWAMLMTETDYAGLQQDALTVPDPANKQAEVAQNQDSSVTESESISGWFSFFKLGMNHILTGYDHLLFLFSLLIARQTFKQYAMMITAFTIAHSITLTLSVLGWINVPPQFVEPAIALSICYVAVDNMVRERVNYRWALTFLFGLIHGMGFADILKEMNLPKSELAMDLISFNVGIETVQVIMVAILLPLLVFLQRWKYFKRVVYTCSSTALALGGIWLIQRLFIG